MTLPATQDSLPTLVVVASLVVMYSMFFDKYRQIRRSRLRTRAYTARNRLYLLVGDGKLGRSSLVFTAIRDGITHVIETSNTSSITDLLYQAVSADRKVEGQLWHEIKKLPEGTRREVEGIMREAGDAFIALFFGNSLTGKLLWVARIAVGLSTQVSSRFGQVKASNAVSKKPARIPSGRRGVAVIALRPAAAIMSAVAAGGLMR